MLAPLAGAFTTARDAFPSIRYFVRKKAIHIVRQNGGRASDFHSSMSNSSDHTLKVSYLHWTRFIPSLATTFRRQGFLIVRKSYLRAGPWS